MPDILWFDSETYSETPIKHGTYRYAEDSEVMLMQYAFDDGEPYCWDLTDPEDSRENHEEFLYALEYTDCVITAHNAMFDRNVLNYNGYSTSISRWCDTMVQAYCHALPGSLEKLCEVLGVPQDLAKNKDGQRLIHLFCKPRPKNMKLRRATRLTHPEDWAKFIQYGKDDIVAMREVAKRLPTYNYPVGGGSNELAHWHLDQKINDRGFHVDLDLVHAAIETSKLEKIELKHATQIMTEGQVASATQRDAILNYILEAHGIVFADLKKGNVEKHLNNPDLPRAVKELLAVRLQATATSVSKYSALARAVNDDGRCRGTIQFGGAARTLRAAGRTFQPQNLASRGLLEDYEIDFGIDAIKQGMAPDFFPNVMHLLTSCVRGCLTAAPGKKLVVADLSNIEGRLAAWFAGEVWKLNAFSDFDKGMGHDLYNLAYSKAFKVDVESVKKPQRAIGKVMELMLGYQGGVGAFLTGALGYGFDIEKLARDNWDTLPADQLAEANSFYAYVIKKRMSTFGLSKEGFITCDVLKRLWRASNHNIELIWGGLENAIVNAISDPGTVHDVGEHLKIRRDKNWLRIRLPSGRYLCYASPRLTEKGNKFEISYMGLNNYTKQWMRLKGYGGLFFENICQAAARDVLYGAMPNAEANGFEIVLHVHDELVTETDDQEFFTSDKLSEIMTSSSTWTAGLPLAAAGFESYRYRK